ncbi:hypothetical protein ABKN59_004088 [Abortiporus biennis]
MKFSIASVLTGVLVTSVVQVYSLPYPCETTKTGSGSIISPYQHHDFTSNDLSNLKLSSRLGFKKIDKSKFRTLSASSLNTFRRRNVGKQPQPEDVYYTHLRNDDKEAVRGAYERFIQRHIGHRFNARDEVVGLDELE